MTKFNLWNIRILIILTRKWLWLLPMPHNFKTSWYVIIYFSMNSVLGGVRHSTCCLYCILQSCIYLHVHVIFWSSILHWFIKHGFLYMQAVVDEWASSLFRVCIVFLYFHHNDVVHRVCVITFDRELRRTWMRTRKSKEERTFWIKEVCFVANQASLI